METPENKKKRKKKTQLVLLQEQEAESTVLAELAEVLAELEKQGKIVDIQICPKCKSPKVRRVETMSGDLWSHMGIAPPKFMCPECGWRARLVLKATNKRLSVRGRRHARVNSFARVILRVSFATHSKHRHLQCT